MVLLKVASVPSFASHALIALSLLIASSIVRADDLQEATRLLRAGQHAQALEQVNRALNAKPRDTQARFIKGTILAELGSGKEAADIFLKLTQDHPELPEPYNNLAVLYAAQNQYDKARVALEQSLRTHPSYATAYGNLSDVYAKLANQAYDKALRLDTASPAIKNNRLALVQELVPVATTARPLTVVAAAAPTASDASQRAAAETGAVPPGRRPAAAAPAVAGVGAHTAQAAPTTSKPAAQAPSPPPVVAPPQAKPQAAEVLETVRAWAAAWSRKDTKTYLAFYAKDFKTPKGEPRADWEHARRTRILGPRSISVAVVSPKVDLRGESSARIKFRQSYRSDVFSGSSIKTLLLVKNEGRWLIAEESVN